MRCFPFKFENCLGCPYKFIFPVNIRVEIPLANFSISTSWWDTRCPEYWPRVIGRTENLVRDEKQIPIEVY